MAPATTACLSCQAVLALLPLCCESANLCCSSIVACSAQDLSLSDAGACGLQLEIAAAETDCHGFTSTSVQLTALKLEAYTGESTSLSAGTEVYLTSNCSEPLADFALSADGILRHQYSGLCVVVNPSAPSTTPPPPPPEGGAAVESAAIGMPPACKHCCTYTCRQVCHPKLQGSELINMPHTHFDILHSHPIGFMCPSVRAGSHAHF